MKVTVNQRPPVQPLFDVEMVGLTKEEMGELFVLMGSMRSGIRRWHSVLYEKASQALGADYEPSQIVVDYSQRPGRAVGALDFTPTTS